MKRSQRWLISSVAVGSAIAHIFPDFRSEVALGEYDLGTELDCEETKCSDAAVRRRVQQVFPHEGYNQDTFENDIAVVQLDREVALSDCEYKSYICCFIYFAANFLAFANIFPRFPHSFLF